jgi:transposase
MRQTAGTRKSPGEKIVQDISGRPANIIFPRRRSGSSWMACTVKTASLNRVVARGYLKASIPNEGIYSKWSKDLLEAGKRRLAGDTARAATTDEVKDLRREVRDLKEVVAEQTLELRLLKKSMPDDGDGHE